jgi:hypothetical protein
MVQRFHRMAALPLIVALLLVSKLVVTAQETILEVEPNDTPQNAAPFQGPSLLIGAMTGTDQDAFL